jgi:hypothetical protein
MSSLPGVIEPEKPYRLLRAGRLSLSVEKATTTLLFGQNLQMHVRLRV